MHFEKRSMLPVSAACLVANAAREALGALFGAPLHLRLFEPVLPSPQAWAEIARDAMLYRVRGVRADAIIVVRPSDAVALATHAFGESECAARPLSQMERMVLERAVRAIAGSCAPVCGISNDAPDLAIAEQIAGFVTYIELQIESPVRARIGIGLSKDPRPEACAGVRVEDLLDLQIDLALRTEGRFCEAMALATLEPEAIVPITNERAIRGTLYLAGRPLASGECGVREGRYAIAVDLLERSERGPRSAT
ncbi:MAG: hypothetical protein ABI282_00945 [Candidatus Baltobacteraceae bacterium]